MLECRSPSEANLSTHNRVNDASLHLIAVMRAAVTLAKEVVGVDDPGAVGFDHDAITWCANRERAGVDAGDLCWLS